MDFKNVPNTSSYPIAEPTEPGGGISSGALDPNAYMGATLQEDDSSRSKPNTKLIYGGILFLFALMTAGSIAFFFYLNSQGAAASERPRYDSVATANPSPKATITIRPTPTFLLQSITPSPTTTPPPVTIFASPTPNKSSQTAAQLTQQATGKRVRWEIIFPKTSYSRAADTNGSLNPVFKGTLHTPLVKGKVVCMTSNQMFFTKKQDEKTISRLCDEKLPTPMAYTLTCSEYDPDVGLEVSASLYPNTNCSTVGEMPETGTYVMAVKVYYDCNAAGGSSNVAPSSCSSSREVFSYDLYYQN